MVEILSFDTAIERFVEVGKDLGAPPEKIHRILALHIRCRDSLKYAPPEAWREICYRFKQKAWDVVIEGFPEGSPSNELPPWLHAMGGIYAQYVWYLVE